MNAPFGLGPDKYGMDNYWLAVKRNRLSARNSRFLNEARDYAARWEKYGLLEELENYRFDRPATAILLESQRLGNE